MRPGPTDAEIVAAIPDDLPVGIWVARAPGGEFVYANRTFAEIMGIAGRDDVAVGEYAAPYGIHDLDGALYPEGRMPFVRALAEQRTVTVDDIVIHRTDGRRVHIRAFARPVFHEGAVHHVVIAFSDISREVEARAERQAAERRARQAQRMESIGALAGGIARDFNNLVGAIRVIATTLAESEGDADRRGNLDAIARATESALELTRALLGFAGGDASVPREPVQLDDVVRTVVQLVTRAIDSRIAIETELRAARAVLGDAGQLEQVVMNLVVNARDAMPAGGTLIVATRDEGGDVVLDVIDTGPGIPTDLRDRVFEPYFTTRDPSSGHGTGLGLATVYGIVTAHGGRVAVLDRIGGAHLEVRLPALAAPARPAHGTRVRAPRGNGERILVVDDEALVRDAAALALRTLGYTVESASDGVEAVAMYANAGGYDAVLLDMAMPRMDGRSTFLALRELDPQVRVLLSTGYALNHEAREIVALGVRGFVDKPYGLAQLGRAIADVLAR